MPKKSKTSCKKMKQIITARLIEISFKVDEYVYNQKPVSVSDAEQYIKEVTSYKAICGRDERSLQVIEKLTRCMKAIIFEHQELTNDNYCEYENYSCSLQADNVRTGSISPVYSISEEDRTQLTQNAEEGANDVVAEATKDIETIDLFNIDDDEVVLEERSHSLSTGYGGSRVNVDVDIHKAISNLSLTDIQDVAITPVDTNCSQSILNNFEGVDKLQQNVIKNTYKGTSEFVGNFSDKISNQNLQTGKRLAYKSKIDNFITITQNKKILKDGNTPNTTIMITANKTNNCKTKGKTLSEKTFPIQIIHTEIQKQTWCDSSDTCSVINDSTRKEVGNSNPIAANTACYNADVIKKNGFDVTNINNTNNVNITSKQLTNNNLTHSAATVNENSTNTKKKRGPRKKMDEKETKPKNKRIYRNVKSVALKKQIPIYNTNVENDLSWMENIRYVREIGVEENDPKLDLEESFWQNYYLPTNWTDNEFL